MLSTGILFALVALISWGVGDFLIQRSTRAFGNGMALFVIAAFGTIALLPFVFDDLKVLGATGTGLGVLLIASSVVLVAALFDFEALRIGKIAVIESVYVFEVPIASALATYVLHEFLTPVQIALVIAIVLGIALTSVPSWRRLRGVKLERGVLYAALATIGMGITNFLFAVGSRVTDPILVNWFTSFFIAVFTFAYILTQGHMRVLIQNLRRSWKLVLSVGFFDNAAWVSYAFSTTYIPIAIATSISESYVALAALLGVFVNRERLRKHQYIGLGLALSAAIFLALISKDVD